MSNADERSGKAVVDLDAGLTGGLTGEAFPVDAWLLLQSFLTPTRRAKMLAVAQGRTDRIRLVIQDIHDPHNVSACLRSADAFGVQQCDAVTLKEAFKASTVARGVSSWLTIKRHHSIETCVAGLRKDGFRIFAGVPPASGVLTLQELPVDQKIAVVFGNEHAGIDKAWLPHVDQPFTIPMYGMVESLNISVGAAITLQYLTDKMRTHYGSAYGYPQEGCSALLNTWICRQLAAWPQMLERLRSGQPAEDPHARR